LVLPMPSCAQKLCVRERLGWAWQSKDAAEGVHSTKHGEERSGSDCPKHGER